MNIAPKVSVGLPVYNGANFIRESIQSILQQDFRDFELIITDNASTDATEAICREIAEGDPRVRYYRNEANIGAAGNYNKVVELARGEYFKWAAHDDECHPAMLRRCVEILDQAPSSVVMVYPLAELIDENGKRLEAPLDRIESRDARPHRRLVRLLWTLNMCDPVFGLIRMEPLRETQLIGAFFGADYVLLGELLMLGQIWEIDEILFRLRAHAKRSMKANASARDRAAWYDPAALKKRLVLPNWERMVLELLKSALRAPLSPAERVKCVLAIAGTHYWRRFKNAGGRMKARIKDSMGMKPSSAQNGAATL
jgi:glycosyltransferase involved in cell wall biosynthesis